MPSVLRGSTHLTTTLLCLALLLGLSTVPAHAITTELIADDLENISAIALDPDDRIFYTEKLSGRVRLIEDGVVQPTPVLEIAVENCVNGGMIGIAIDPDFANNHYFYVHYTEDVGMPCGLSENIVARYTEVDGVGIDPLILFTAPIDTLKLHTANNINFGPDGKLYISLGDGGSAALSQDLSSKQGKIHRINTDGSIPVDNPFFSRPGAEPSIYAYGFRNSFDFDFDPMTNTLFATENGPECDDELNRVIAGYNYGWRPDSQCDDVDQEFNTIQPLRRWTPTFGPTGILFYYGDMFLPIRGRILMCHAIQNPPFRDQMRMIALDPERSAVANDNVVQLDIGEGCALDIEMGSDGSIYYINGGGHLDGRIYRITP